MTYEELRERQRRVSRQLKIQALFEATLLAILGIGSFALIFIYMVTGNPLHLLGSWGFIAAIWINSRLGDGRWDRLREWMDGEHAETMRLIEEERTNA